MTDLRWRSTPGWIVGVLLSALSVALLSRVESARTLALVQPPSPYTARIDLVNIAVTVTDKRGALITDLGPEDFEIEEDGRKQTPSYFAVGEPADPPPELHLGLMLDVSGSMEDDLPFTKTAAVKFLKMLGDAVDITVVDFDSEVRVARYSQAEFARVVERIRQKKGGGETAIYDAVGVYLDGAGGQGGRKIMLLYTDGGDTSSSMALHELVTLLKASDVTVYVIGLLEHQLPSVKSQQRMVMHQIAEVAGGQVFFPTSVKQLDDVYQKVLAEIRAQYILGYVSTNTKADGSWRRVNVRVVRKDDRGLRVRSRQGYFAAYKK